MKIGVLTFHAPSNFGANLQAYSSVCYYKSLGHEVCILNYLRTTDEKYRDSVNYSQYKEHARYVREELPVTGIIRNVDELKAIMLSEHIELLSIGADAVWRVPKSEANFLYFADWLFSDDRLKDIPVVSLSAAHMGNGFTGLPAKSKARLKHDLSQFTFITVRDTWTRQKMNEDIFGAEYIKHINPDPVIWLSDFIGNRKPLLQDKLAGKPYYLMSLPVRCSGKSKLKCWFKEFKSLVNSNGYNLVELPIPEGISGFDFDYTIPFPINPFDWFCYIGEAKAFCGLRYHAIVSCISSGTPFYSLDSYGNTSRLLMILNRLGYYRFVRHFDKNSKIRNLLLGSEFENHRISGYLENISPKVLFNILEQTERSGVISFRDELRAIFKHNTDELFKAVNHGNRKY